MSTTLLKLSSIDTTAGTQIRAEIDGDTVGQYAEAMLDTTNKFPPVVVFHDGSKYILADGFHRIMAATRNGFLDIEADVRKGTKADALGWALSANVAHGLRRSNADKRRSVVLALAEWPKLSDREIARLCAVDDHTVAAVRKEQEPTAEIPQLPQVRIGADGKSRHRPAKRKKANPAPTRNANLVPEEKPVVVAHVEVMAPDRVMPPPETKHRLPKPWHSKSWVQYRKTSPLLRAGLLMAIIETRKPVEVPDRRAFEEALRQWMDKCVVEATPTPSPKTEAA